MGSNIFNIGLTGLNAAQAHLATAGHNISNAATPGYHRQRVELQTAPGQGSADGFFGAGVDISTVSRIYSSFLDNQLVAAQGRQSYLDAYRDEIAQIDNLLADTNSGLTPALSEFFNTVQEVAADPESAASRQAMLSGAQTLVGRFRALEARVSQMHEAANRQVTELVTSINGLSAEVARLNQSVVMAEAGFGGHAANDLRDQRDKVVADLIQLTGGTTVTQSDGSINVMIGNGQNIVVGSTAMALTTASSRDDSKRLDIAYASGSGSSAVITSALTGGKLGAILGFQNDTLTATLNGLGRIGIALASDFNQQHRLGQDLNGAAGGDFFTVPTPALLARVGNAGTAALTATLVDASALTISDYRIEYGASGYTVTRLADGTASVYASLPQTVDGVRIALGSGAPANGDSFLLQPTRTGGRDLAVQLGDGALIAAAAPISSAANVANTGTGAISAGRVNAPPPTDPNLLQPVTITFTSAGTFDVSGTGTGNPTGVAYVSGGTIGYNGWTVSISGTPRAGDSFTIRPNVGGVSDNRNATLLAALQTRISVGGSASYQGAYSQTVAAVGTQTRELQVAATAQEAFVAQTRTAQQSLSGVNLDEEAANLIRYQQMYQACGKMIEIASKLFDSLLAI